MDTNSSQPTATTTHPIIASSSNTLLPSQPRPQPQLQSQPATTMKTKSFNAVPQTPPPRRRFNFASSAEINTNTNIGEPFDKRIIIGNKYSTPIDSPRNPFSTAIRSTVSSSQIKPVPSSAVTASTSTPSQTNDPPTTKPKENPLPLLSERFKSLGSPSSTSLSKLGRDGLGWGEGNGIGSGMSLGEGRRQSIGYDGFGSGVERVRSGIGSVSEGSSQRGMFEGYCRVGESRYLMITGLEKSLCPEEIKRQVLTVTAFKALVFAFLKEQGTIIVILHDPRASFLIANAINHNRLPFTSTTGVGKPEKDCDGRMDGDEKVMLHGLQERMMSSLLDGEHIKRIMAENEAGVCVTMDGNAQVLSADALKNLLERYGELRFFRAIGQSQTAYIAEYFDAREAHGVVNELHNRRFADSLLFLSTMTIDWAAPSTSINESATLYNHYLRFTRDAESATLLMTGLNHMAAPSPQMERKHSSSSMISAAGSGDSTNGNGSEHSTMYSTPSSSMRQASVGKYISPRARAQAAEATNQGDSPSSKTDHLSWRRSSNGSLAETTPEKPNLFRHSSQAAFSPSSDSATALSPSSTRSSYSLNEVREARSFWERREAELLATPPNPSPQTQQVYHLHPDRDSPSARSRFLSMSNLASAASVNSNDLAKMGVFEDYGDSIKQAKSFSGGSRSSVDGFKQKSAHYKEMVPPENRLTVEGLASGRDPRTTVMIKNIPNKLTRQQLIEAIEDIVPGEIDFVYLRFDFINKCNVAYAFVNFTSVDALYRFASERLGVKWNVFMSEKEMQMAYATIQGRDALVGHFRNSSVMDVAEEWRPLLLHRGKPIPFPEPTQQKMIRRPSHPLSSNLMSSGAQTSTTPFNNINNNNYHFSSSAGGSSSNF